MSDKWVDHLKGLAVLEDNVGKRVAFETSADEIQSLEAELESLKKAYGLAMTENAELRREVERLKQVITAQSTRGA